MHKKASYGSFGNHHFAFPDLYIQNPSSNVYEYNCVEFPYVQIKFHKLLTVWKKYGIAYEILND